MAEYKIDLHPKVHSALHEAVFWYESQKTGLGEQLLCAVMEKLDAIAYSPFAFSSKGKIGYREATVRGYPYLIVYMIYHERQTVFVASIHHTSRNPGLKYPNE